MIAIRRYVDGILKEENFAPERISECLDAGELVWLDVVDPSDDDIAMCQEEFELHPEAVKDIKERDQRTKVDLYPDRSHFVVVAYGISGGPEELQPHEIHIFVGTNFLLTFRFEPAFDLSQVLRRWESYPDATNFGGGGLLHHLLDEIVDSYLPVISRFDEAIEDLEDRIFSAKVESGLQEDLFQLKKKLIEFRRYVLPLQDVLDFLQEDTLVITEDLKPYFRDVHDNVYRSIEFADNTRETLTTALGAYQATVGNQMNLSMKKLTAWAAILLVPTLIAGIYGMNFDNMPELRWSFGYYLALGAMVVLGVTLYLQFKKRDWL